MQKDLDTIIFIGKINLEFSGARTYLLSVCLEELNSAATPALRYPQSELLRLAEFERRFLELLDLYPGNRLPESILKDPRGFYCKITGTVTGFFHI